MGDFGIFYDYKAVKKSFYTVQWIFRVFFLSNKYTDQDNYCNYWIFKYLNNENSKLDVIVTCIRLKITLGIIKYKLTIKNKALIQEFKQFQTQFLICLLDR